MSWDCPHKGEDDFCNLRKARCVPGAKKCVLEGKVKFISEGRKKNKDKND
ncbi:MAG: hypothetical protein ACYTFY_15445 [Planctomycetota bacterium]|jgi:hypothetical protein